MTKQNCWEFKGCGREQGGAKSGELGVCPAAMDAASEGVNSGTKGGRLCWALTGTLCGGSVQGTYAQKMTSCMACEFFKKVRTEEGMGNFTIQQT